MIHTTIKDSKTVILSPHPAIQFAWDSITVWVQRQNDSRDIVATPPRHNLRITGLQEEGHSFHSKHYGIVGDHRCRAFDEHGALNEDDVDDIQRLLGTTFYVAWETNHMHIHWDPWR
jgi:hypothetical protein